MSDAEYQDWLHSQGHKPVTQEEKQKLYEEAEAAEKERIERELDLSNSDLYGPNSKYGI